MAQTAILEGAAEDGTDGIKLERINGREYYTRVVYVSSATSTWIDDYKTKVYSTDAVSGKSSVPLHLKGIWASRLV